MESPSDDPATVRDERAISRQVTVRPGEHDDRPAGGPRAGRYELGAVLGAGGMGEVIEATDPALGRRVAYKRMRAGPAADPAALARFQREARITAQRGADPLLTREGSVMGTPAYMPPEQAQGQVALLDTRISFWRISRSLDAETKARDSERSQRERAERIADDEREATRKFLRISDLRALAALKDQAEDLWPAHRGMIPRFRAWLRDANELAARLPGHRASLSEPARSCRSYCRAAPSGWAPRRPLPVRAGDSLHRARPARRQGVVTGALGA